jgi:predicted outer membrane protein
MTFRRGEGVRHTMIADHTRTSEELKWMAPADAKPSIPAALDNSSQSKIDKLKNAKPDDFSSEFDSMQVSAHKDAVSLFERMPGTASRPYNSVKVANGIPRQTVHGVAVHRWTPKKKRLRPPGSGEAAN